MGFEKLLGNERLRENLRAAIQKGRISHFYLISGPAGSGKHTLARLLAAAILCGGAERPCMSCPVCRKVMADTHPDFITVDDPEKKTVAVELVRKASADIYIQPNEGSHKIYLFPRAQDMLIPSQNALLKVLEEPPKYGVFILLTDNPEKLLPTVRSRCTELAMTALPEKLLTSVLRQRYPQVQAETLAAAAARSGGFLGQAMELLEQGAQIPEQTARFAAAFAKRSALELVRVLAPMEKWKRDQLLPMLQQWLELLEAALVCRSGHAASSPLAYEIGTARSSRELYSAITHLQKSIEYTQGNVSPAAVCGYLEWTLR
ncbi:MAG: DNA polymerase III subunit [Oscillospiraceae bacterium]|nr:DNA polymerase III subunit [Oscillospiraceae bacterium]